MSDPIAVPRAERIIHGTGIAPGVAIGRPCMLTVRTTRREPDPHGDAIHTVGRALDKVRARLRRLAAAAQRRGDRQGAEIFDAHRMILSDPEVTTALLDAAQPAACDAGEPIRRVFDGYVATFNAIGDEYLRARAADFIALKNQLLDVLGQRNVERYCREATHCTIDHCLLGNDHIVIAPELDAHVAAKLDRATCGFVVASGSTRSHAAFIARGLGLPVVAGVPDPVTACGAATTLVVDGDNGHIVLDPSIATLARYEARQRACGRGIRNSTPVPGFSVMADLDRAQHVDDVAAAGAEGIGLYRTEIELVAHGRLLDEASQAALYTRVVEGAHGAPASIRLFDLGYDKTIPGLDLAPAPNPALGLRGARLLLAYPEILRAQARAVALASRHGAVDVIYPMIASGEQFRHLREAFRRAIADLPAGPMRHGVMFEVPAACLAADELLALADFGRVGTSDLTQYLFAVDRDAPGDDFDAMLDGDAFWTLLADLARRAREARRPLSVCGSVAADPGRVAALMRAGIRAVSVEPRRIADIRRAAAGRAPC